MTFLRPMFAWHLIVTAIFTWAFFIVLGHRENGVAGANLALAALAIAWTVAMSEVAKYVRSVRSAT